MVRILMTIAYDGTAYSGWQKQQDPAVRTVEGVVEEGLRQLFRKDDLTIIGASRTDAGVHALGQRAIVDVDTTIPLEKIPLAVRPFLPEDVVIRAAREVAPQFHPRFDCVKKTYAYRIWNDTVKNPKERLYAEFCYQPLDVEKMEQAAQALCGTHDFQTFCAAGNQSKTTVRTIFSCHVVREGNAVTIFVTGDGFLYHMVRIIAGTLMQVGMGRIQPEDMAGIIASCDRKKAGPTAGAAGLTLQEIFYEKEDLDGIESAENQEKIEKDPDFSEKTS